MKYRKFNLFTNLELFSLTLAALVTFQCSLHGQAIDETTRLRVTRQSRTAPDRLMQQSLGLTDQQMQKLDPILKEEQNKVSALRANTNLSRRDRAANMKEIRESTDAKIKEHLTPEQAGKWKGRVAQALQPATAAATNRLTTRDPIARWQKPSGVQPPALGGESASPARVVHSQASTNAASTNATSSYPTSAAPLPAPASSQYQTNRYTHQVRPRPSVMQSPPPVTGGSTNSMSAKPGQERKN